MKEYNRFLCYTPESKSVEFSGKHSFTLHPSLDPYGQNHRWRDTLILVGLATLMGSSRLILVGLATLTGSSRLIRCGLGNNWFLQVKLIYSSTKPYLICEVCDVVRGNLAISKLLA